MRPTVQPIDASLTRCCLSRFINASIIGVVADHLSAVIEILARLGEWQPSQSEREWVDFKETPETAIPPEHSRRAAMSGERKGFLGQLAEAAVCLSNAGGGVIVLGVRDKATSRADALRGVDAALYPLEAIRLAIHNGTSPPLTCDAFSHDEDGVHLVLIRVPHGAVVHGTTGGVYKRRVGDQCLPIPSDIMRDLNAARGQYDWSAGDTGLDAGTISPAALIAAGDALRRAGRIELADLAERDPVAFLTNCGLVGVNGLKRAAIILYGRPEALGSLVPDWGVIVTAAPSPGAEGTVVMRKAESRERPIILLIEEVVSRLSVLSSVETFRAGARQIEMVDYPEDVIRELVANAFAHRDWERSGTIQILHTPDELVISSPGALLPTLHADRLLRETAQRNRLLAGEIARLKLAEGAGLGFDRVWRSLAILGKPPPSITPGPDFIVGVPGGQGDSAFAKYVQGLTFPARLGSDLDVLLILAWLRSHRTVNAPSIAPTLQRDDAFTQRVLHRMQDESLVEPTRATARSATPTYRLTAAVRIAMRGALVYRVESIDSDDEKLLGHLRRYRRISNQDVRDYLDCDVMTARNRLQRMRSKGWIDFDPKGPLRGANVQYVAKDLPT